MTQERFATVTTPAGDALSLHAMVGEEELGRLFSYELELLSTDPNIKDSDMLGESATVHVELPAGGTRHFNGVIVRFGYVGQRGRYYLYEATLRPWLWLLSNTSDCRIFQHLSAPEVVLQVMRLEGFSDIELALSCEHPAREYIVQYRETAYTFISRLLEEEGIYYFFRHDDGRHTLVLADTYGAHESVPGYAEIPYFPPEKDVTRERDHISSWSASRQVRTGTYTLNAFDFKNPKAGLMVRGKSPGDYGHADQEFYEYPGEYETVADGERIARLRIEELQATEGRFSGDGDVRGLMAGALFTLTQFPRDAFNCEYLVIAARYSLDASGFESFQGDDASAFRCSLRAIESKVPFIPERTTPRPTIVGPQTALVVGAANDEIYTDNFGRAKVQFHWDREGKKDENSSCWVRVAQASAGSRWGAIYLPRVGHEVLVEFLEGDPDRPIITGSVYNADHPPPYDLPANKTQSGYKSRSTKGGGANNFNELRFEDKKGEEQVYVQAERNMDTLVKADQTLTVEGARSKAITLDEITTVGGSRTETVTGDEAITILGARSESVTQAETITLAATRETTITLSDTLKIGQGFVMSVGAGSRVGVTGAYEITIGQDQTAKVSGDDSLRVTKDQSVSVLGQRAQKIDGNDTLDVGKNLIIEAGEQITIKVGDASLVMKKNGDIVLAGKNVLVKGTAKINVNANSDVIIKGTKISQN